MRLLGEQKGEGAMASQSACREHRNDCLWQLRNVGLVLAIALIATGCANPAAYWKARQLDLLDTGSLGVGYGIGLSAHVQASELVHGAVGFSSGRLYGSRRRHVGAWKEVDMGWPATFILLVSQEPELLYIHAVRAVFLLSTLVLPTDLEVVTSPGEGKGLSRDDNEELIGCLINPLFTRHVAVPLVHGGHIPPYEPRGEFSLSFMALVVGARVSFNPVQLGDFLVGFFGLDPAGDDWG